MILGIKNYKAESLAGYEKLRAVLKEQSEEVRDKIAEMESLTDGMQRAFSMCLPIEHVKNTHTHMYVCMLIHSEQCEAVRLAGCYWPNERPICDWRAPSRAAASLAWAWARSIGNGLAFFATLQDGPILN